jgi:ribose transport system substrate-binding protein
MSTKRYWLWITPIAILAVAAAIWYLVWAQRLSEPETGAPVRVAFVTGGPGEYWDEAVRGARAAAEKLKVNLDVQAPAEHENVAQQIEILSQANLSQLNGLGLSPLDAEGEAQLINRIAQATKVVTFDSDAPQTSRTTFVGTNNFAAGQMAAQLTRNALPEGGKVAVLVVNLTKDNVQDRKRGFSEALAGEGGETPKIEIVGVLEDHGQADQCGENVRKALADHPDLAGFIAMNGSEGPILLKTLRDSGKLGKMKLVTFDDAPETLAGVEDGSISATVVQDPYQFGYETIRILADLSRGNGSATPGGYSTSSVSPVSVTKDNLEGFRKKSQSKE